MPVTTTAVFICDRDGVEAESSSTLASVNPPPGWGRILFDKRTADDTPLEIVTGFLCPNCVTALASFIGGTFARL